MGGSLQPFKHLSSRLLSRQCPSWVLGSTIYASAPYSSTLPWHGALGGRDRHLAGPQAGPVSVGDQLRPVSEGILDSLRLQMNQK